MTVNESDQVQAGQIIARMRSRDLEKVILEQTGLLKGKLIWFHEFWERLQRHWWV